MKSFKTVPHNSSKVRVSGEFTNYQDLFTNALENGGLVDILWGRLEKG